MLRPSIWCTTRRLVVLGLQQALGRTQYYGAVAAVVCVLVMLSTWCPEAGHNRHSALLCCSRLCQVDLGSSAWMASGLCTDFVKAKRKTMHQRTLAHDAHHYSGSCHNVAIQPNTLCMVFVQQLLACKPWLASHGGLNTYRLDSINTTVVREWVWAQSTVL